MRATEKINAAWMLSKTQCLPEPCLASRLCKLMSEYENERYESILDPKHGDQAKLEAKLGRYFGPWWPLLVASMQVLAVELS